MNEVYDKLDALYLQPATERRSPSHYEKVRKINEIDMIMHRLKFLAALMKRRSNDSVEVPFIVDAEGNC